MPEHHEVVHTRGQQTGAVWNTFNAAFTVGALTRALHAADVADVFTKANLRDLAQDAVDDARATRVAGYGVIADLNIRIPRAVEGQIEAASPFHGEISDCRDIVTRSDDSALARGRRVINLLTRVNVERAAAVPPLPVLTVGGVTVAQFTTLVNAHPALMQAVEDRRSDLNKTRSTLQAVVDLVDENNKRWFAAWQGEYAEGYPERAALTQIDTGPQTLVPSPLVVNTITPQAAGRFAAVYVAGGGAHATVLQLQWKVAGVDAEFGHDSLVVLTGQTVVTGAAPGTPVTFRTKAHNSQGTTYSAEQTRTAL